MKINESHGRGSDWGGAYLYLDGVVREDLPEEVIFEQKGEGIGPGKIWKKNSRQKAQCMQRP